MNIIMLGPPGAGKGTLSEMIAKTYSLPTLSTGDLIRDEMKRGTKFGAYARKIIDKGKLVPDKEMTDKLFEELKKPKYKNGVILDGYPRTLGQTALLEKKKFEIDAVIELTVTKETILQRLSGRRTCRKCNAIFHIKNHPPKKEGVCDRCGGELYQRHDQKPEIIVERRKEYKKKTQPLVDHYTKKKLLLTVNTETKPEEILQNVIVLLQGKYPT